MIVLYFVSDYRGHMSRDSIAQLVYNPLKISVCQILKIRHPQSENDQIKPVSEIIFFCEFQKLSYFEEKGERLVFTFSQI